MTNRHDRINGDGWRRRQVAKPTVCKTVIHRFESGRRLQNHPRAAQPASAGIFFALALALLGPLAGACKDPPPPPPERAPEDLPRWSKAPYVLWSGPQSPVSRPLAVFVDDPGGPLDRIIADVDVTTFLNDRFHPWFLTPEVAPGLVPSPPQALILDAAGCLRVAPFLPESPSAWIAVANRALIELAEGRAATGALPEVQFGFLLSPEHPLRGQCRGQARSPG